MVKLSQIYAHSRIFLERSFMYQKKSWQTDSFYSEGEVSSHSQDTLLLQVTTIQVRGFISIDCPRQISSAMNRRGSLTFFALQDHPSRAWQVSHDCAEDRSQGVFLNFLCVFLQFSSLFHVHFSSFKNTFFADFIYFSNSRRHNLDCWFILLLISFSISYVSFLIQSHLRRTVNWGENEKKFTRQAAACFLNWNLQAAGQIFLG